MWTQQCPADNPTEGKEVQGFFYIRVVDLSTQIEDREKILESNPAWLRAQTDKIRYLSLRVRLQIFERPDIRILDRESGFKFNLSG